MESKASHEGSCSHFGFLEDCGMVGMVELTLIETGYVAQVRN